MSGEFIAHDEWFTTAGGDTYRYMVAPRAALSNVSSSPFAPKSVFGDRSYADYEAISAIAMADFSGGMGQERFQDATQYYDGHDVDTRGKRIALAPFYTATTETFPHTLSYTSNAYYNYRLMISAITPRRAQRYDAPADVTHIRCVWLFMRANYGFGAATVKLYNNVDGLPGTELASTTVGVGWNRGYGQWVQAIFSPIQTITPNASYWISVENTSETHSLFWLEGNATATNETAAYGLAGWSAGSGRRYAMWVDDYAVRPDSIPTPFIGVGADDMPRVWMRAGAALYYMAADSTPTCVLGNLPAEPAPQVRAPHICDAGIVAHAWFRTPADTTAWLYCGLGDDNDMVRFNGNIGTETWETLTGHKARRLCVHDNMLVYAYDRNKVDCYNGSLWGQSATSAVEVGDRTYVIRNMVSWSGYIWVGKDDGLYRITIPTGYPVTGALACQKIIDFTPQADDSNFQLMLTHMGDLWFSISNGLMRYTVGNVLNPVSPDVGLSISSSKRMTFRSAVSTISTLFVLAEASVSDDSESGTSYVGYAGTSYLMAYTDGHWHPLNAFPQIYDMRLGGMCLEPGWYGLHPRLWFGRHFRVHYMDMPTNTQRRWLVEETTYKATGYLLTSWIDGNVRTIYKHWMSVELSATLNGGSVTAYYRTTDGAAWTTIGTYNASSTSIRLLFPTNTYSYKVQLKIELARPAGSTYSTPTVEAIILRYMERPEDVRAHTRTYRLADRGENRNGALVTRTVGQQLAELSALREEKAPLNWHGWYDDTAITRQVHIVDFSVSEMPEEQRDTGDRGQMLIVCRLQEVD